MKNEKKSFSRQKRSYEIFETIEMFDAIGRGQQLSFGNGNDKKRFLDIISSSLDKNITDNRLYGKRVEAMFSYMVASLGKCIFIKQEDSGDTFSKLDVQIPDYRLAFNNGRQILIEVKNYHQKNTSQDFKMKKSYIAGLINYTNLMNIDLYIAIYWSKFGLWTLATPEDFELNSEKVSIKFTAALEKNSMIEIGDYIIATTPPIAIRLMTDKEKPHNITESGVGEFTVGDVQLICNSNFITEDNEKRIILSLILYGNWNEELKTILVSDTDAEIDYIEFSYSPTEIEDTEENYQQGFRTIDFMSTLISRQYISLTTDNGKV